MAESTDWMLPIGAEDKIDVLAYADMMFFVELYNEEHLKAGTGGGI